MSGSGLDSASRFWCSVQAVPQPGKGRSTVSSAKGESSEGELKGFWGHLRVRRKEVAASQADCGGWG